MSDIDPTNPRLTNVDPANLRLSAVGTSTLSDSQSERLRVIWAALKRFPSLCNKDTFEQFEADFSRDRNPENEIVLWEKLIVLLRGCRREAEAKTIFVRW